MRSILITAAVFVLLVVAFIAFVLTQKGSAPVVKRRAATSGTPVLREGGGGGVGPGEGGWVKSYDPKNGELLNEFRADTFDQPVNDKIHVVRPEARFYSSDGSVLSLKADTGDITLAQAARKSRGFGSMQGRPPSHGTLHEVELGFFENETDALPVLTCYLPVVAFDNDLLRLDTVAMADKAGRKLAADQVPVTVRGRDYDFDGEGLTVRYNQRDRRLERLEVAHGKRLTVKNAKTFGDTPGGPLAVLDEPKPRRAGDADFAGATYISFASVIGVRTGDIDVAPTGSRSGGFETPLADAAGRPIELASADPAAGPQMTREEREVRRQKREAATRRADREAREAKRHRATQPATRRATTRPREIVAYTASFQNDVTVREAGTQVGQGDRMDVTFTFEKSTATTRPAVVAPAAGIGPATRPARQVVTTQAGEAAVVQPSTRRSRRQGPATQRATAASQPGGPVEVRWTGKLVVTPQKLASSGLKSSADRIVAFTGKPVRLARDGSTITAASVWAATEGRRFNAASDPTTPQVTVTDARGTTIVTENISADGDDANLYGKSSAEVVLDGENGRGTQTLRTTWKEFAAIRSATGPGDRRGIERAVFRGDVEVRHSKLDLNSDTLALGFANGTPAERPQLSIVRADGRVKAGVRNGGDRPQSIAADTLELGLSPKPGRELAVDTLHANGNVVASDGRQTLRTDDLKTTLSDEPGGRDASAKTPPSLAVDTLTATGRVDVRTDGGQSVVADRLTVEKQSGLQWVTLYGQDAVITDSGSRVSGRKISIDATGSRASIEGPGQLVGTPKSDDGKPGRPVEVKWTDGMQYDAAGDAARVFGNVVVHTVGSDRTDNAATGKTLDIAFAAAPATRPATKTAATKPFGVGGDKQIKGLTLAGDGAPDAVKITSYLYDQADPAKLLRKTVLHAPLLKVNVNADGSPGEMNVPAGGRVLYEELPGARPANAPADAPAPGGAVGAFARGTVALQWTRLMRYDPSAKQVTLDGDVVVVHEDFNQQQTRLAAPKLVADISGGVTPQGVQLKRVTTTGGTTLDGRNVRLVADHAEFDPAADLIKAFGTARQPVQWFEQGGVSRGSFGELWWNLKDNRPEKLKDVTMEMNR